MDIYHGDLVSTVFFILGIVVLFKKKVNLTFIAGATGTNNSMNENSKYTMSRDIELKGYPKLVLGCTLIAVSIFVIYNFRGELAFSI